MAMRQRLTPAIKIALVYLVFAVVWILLSDRVLRWLVPDADTISVAPDRQGARLRRW